MMRGTAKQITARARMLVEQGWIQGSFAKNEAGDKVNFTDPGAISFCALGAILRAKQELVPGGNIPDQFWDAWGDPPYESTTEWNDASSTTKQDVLDRFDRTFARL